VDGLLHHVYDSVFIDDVRSIPERNAGKKLALNPLQDDLRPQSGSVEPQHHHEPTFLVHPRVHHGTNDFARGVSVLEPHLNTVDARRELNVSKVVHREIIPSLGA